MDDGIKALFLAASAIHFGLRPVAVEIVTRREGKAGSTTVPAGSGNGA